MTPEERREHDRKYYAENKDRINARRKEWRAKNRDKVKAWQDKYRHANMDKFKAYRNEYYAKNREQVLLNHRAWRKANGHNVREVIEEVETRHAYVQKFREHSPRC